MSPLGIDASNSSRCAFCFSQSTFNSVSNALPCSWTGSGNFSSLAFNKSARSPENPFDFLSATTSLRPTASVVVLPNALMSLEISIGPTVLSVSVRASNCSSLNLARPITVASW